MMLPMSCQVNQTNCVTVKGGTCKVEDISHTNNPTFTLSPQPSTTTSTLQSSTISTQKQSSPQTNAPVSPSTKVSNVGVAIVFDPPSNVRTSPNGKILCSVRENVTVNIYGSVDDWYYTDVCGNGTKGVIHSTQVRF
jgi:hypothetical protein